MSNPYPPGTYPAKLYDNIHGSDTTVSGGKPLKYIPTGIIDGVNQIFTFPVAPPVNAFYLWWNGLLQSDGDDYILSGNILSTVFVAKVGDKLIASF